HLSGTGFNALFTAPATLISSADRLITALRWPASSPRAKGRQLPGIALTELMLLVAGLIAGALNTLAGGGSFVAFPALLAAGVTPVIANATNTFAAMPGYISGAAGFREELVRHRKRLVPYTAIALLFGYVGAELLLHVS